MSKARPEPEAARGALPDREDMQTLLRSLPRRSVAHNSAVELVEVLSRAARQVRLVPTAGTSARFRSKHGAAVAVLDGLLEDALKGVS